MAHQRRDSQGPGAEGAAWVPITQEETSVHAPPDRDSSTSPALQMGSQYLKVARRFIRKEKRDASKWSVVRSKLLGGVRQAELRKELSNGRTVFSDENVRLATYGSLNLERSELGLNMFGPGSGGPKSASPAPERRASIVESVVHARLSRAVRGVIFARWLNLLLLFLPFGLTSYLLSWGEGWTFFLNFLGLIPLAAMLGDLTEEVAEHTGDTIGGIINASFGNLVEMLIGVQALLKREYRVVQASMLGSVLSNLLLVTGCCFLIGGIYNKEQRFSAAAGVANLSLLFLATLAVVVPTPIGESYNLSDRDILFISRIAALFLLFMYLQLIIFQMVTHKHLFEPDEEDTEVENDGDEEEEPKLTLVEAMVGLCIVAVVTGMFSEMLVDSIDGMTKQLQLSKVFVGVILLPLVGNATEHMTAVSVAVRNRMELAMGIAVGSATQVAIFVIPFLVLTGWILGRDMSLEFPVFEVVIFVMSVLITVPVLLTASSHWLLGSFLVTSYVFCAFAFWFENGGLDDDPKP